MSAMNQVTIPARITWLAYAAHGYEFAYPQGSLFAEFDHGEGIFVLNVIFKHLDHYLQCTIQRQPNDTISAEASARAAYTQAASHFDTSDNMAPYAIKIAGTTGWRTRKRFVDAGNAPLVIDQVYLQSNQASYSLSLSAAPDEYPQVRWVFEALLATFRLAAAR